MTDINNYLKKEFPLLEGLWGFDHHTMHDDNCVTLLVGDSEDFISVKDDIYRTGDFAGEFTGTLSDIITRTDSWKALEKIAREIPIIRKQLRGAAPVEFYGHVYKYLGVFAVTPGYSHGIITLRHDILGMCYVTASNSAELIKVDAILARIAAE